MSLSCVWIVKVMMGIVLTHIDVLRVRWLHDFLDCNLKGGCYRFSHLKTVIFASFFETFEIFIDTFFPFFLADIGSTIV